MMACSKFILVCDRKTEKDEDPIPLIVCSKKCTRRGSSTVSERQDKKSLLQTPSKSAHGAFSLRQSLPTEIHLLLFCYAASDPLSAINLALTCKTFLALGRFVTVPSDASSSRTCTPMAVPVSLQSCDLCKRYWLTGGDHDDTERWQMGEKMEGHSSPEIASKWTYVRCPGDGERARTVQKVRNSDAGSAAMPAQPAGGPRGIGTSIARNRLAEEISLFSQALLGQ